MVLLDADRGLLYIAAPAGLEIWQVYNNCCDLAVDTTTELSVEPSGEYAKQTAWRGSAN